MKRNEKGKKYLQGILFCLTLALCFLLGGERISAAESLKIKSCVSTGADELALETVLPQNISGSYEIYRTTVSPAKGGKFKLIDKFPVGGNSWTSSNGGAWYTKGTKGKVYCFADKPSFMSGKVFFYDTKLKLGQKYYYRIMFRPSGEGKKVYSNIVSGKTALQAPEIIQCCSTANDSVKLSWTGTEKAQGYAVYRSDGKKWTFIKRIAKGSVTTFTDRNVKAKKTYRYKVKAFRKVNQKSVYSPYSQIVKVTLKAPTVKGAYSQGSVYGPSLGTSQLSEVRRVVQGFKDNYIRKGMSDYEKVWAAFCYLQANCKYARRGWQYNNANTAWGALVYGEAQCSGFARGMKALCDAIGVDCRYVHADERASNPSHQWNQVKVGGKWYILDAQGGFFLVGTDTWRNMMGMSWNTSGLPTCQKKNHSKGGFTWSIT